MTENKVQFQNKIQKVLVIASCWMVLILFSYINDYYFVADLIKMDKLQGTYDFWPDFFGHLILGIFGGLVGGYLLVFRMDGRYKRKSFAYGIFNAGITFVTYYLVLSAVGLFLMNVIYFSFQISFIDAVYQALRNVWTNIYTPSYILVMILTGLIVSSTQFMLQINDKFGSGVLWKFITGKYYLPRQEDRIFMFLDLKASTTIAEKIGHQEFFKLIQELFRDITDPIINSLGEIYQYVGDEVIITWTQENGLKQNNCLSCFFDIRELITEKSEHYLKKYGQVPVFKAGLHTGEATVGEIGVIKKDIVYSGDVLNTTARIQSECNNYNVDILISSQMLSRLSLSDMYENVFLGDIRLRGKLEKVQLNTIRII